MTELFLNAFFAVRGFHGSLSDRARTERGASMVEYALLVGLIAVVAVVAVAALGGGISGLFSSANTCVGGLNSTSCSSSRRAIQAAIRGATDDAPGTPSVAEWKGLEGDDAFPTYRVWHRGVPDFCQRSMGADVEF